MINYDCPSKNLSVIVGFLFLAYPLVGIIVRVNTLINSPKEMFYRALALIAFTTLFEALLVTWCLLALFCHTAQPYALSLCLGCGWLLTTLHMSAISSSCTSSPARSVRFCSTTSATSWPSSQCSLWSSAVQPKPFSPFPQVASKYAANLGGFYDVEPGKSTALDNHRKAFAQYTYFGYVFVTAVILINILIAMMAESYARVVA